MREIHMELITKKQAIDALGTITVYKGSIPFNTAVMRIEQLPPAQPEPKRGRWIYKTDLITAPTGYWECSECKEGRLLYEENFCPHCGADMREVTT